MTAETAPPLRPRALEPGARVALVAPAGPVDSRRVEEACARCRGMELHPVPSPSSRARHRFLAGSDATRLADLQEAFDDPAVDAVWALRGGYGTQRIVDRLDLARQLRDPIPFVGFSDNTALLARHAALGVVSVHGPHPSADLTPGAEAHLRRLLFRTEPPGALPPPEGEPPPRTLVDGVAEGRLVGGNLAILASLCGTRDAPLTRGRILFLEDVGEPAYRVDRMLLQLRRSGALEGVTGLALGRFTRRDPSEPEEHPVEDVLREYARAAGVPTVSGLAFGHVPDNHALPVGGRARLDGSDASLTLLEPAVRGG